MVGADGLDDGGGIGSVAVVIKEVTEARYGVT